MSKCKDMTLRLGQANAVQTMDQQLYAVAQQVKWTKPEEFQNHQQIAIYYLRRTYNGSNCSDVIILAF